MSSLPQAKLFEEPKYQEAQFRALESTTRLREVVTMVLLGLFVVTVLFELGVTFTALAGWAKPDVWVLLAPTFIAVPQVPPLLLIVVRWLFPAPSD